MPQKLRERRESEIGAQFSSKAARAPEKHYVRLNGWLEAARGLSQGLAGEPLRYFSLCGKEPFDVLMLFRAGLLSTDMSSPNVVVCDINNEDLTAAGEAIVRAGYGPVIKFNSSVEDLILGDDELHSRFVGLLPFHIYNLDFTKQIFYRKERIGSGMWATVERIITLQSQHEQDFDLFITSRSLPTEILPEARAELLHTMTENVASVQGLTEIVAQRYGADVSLEVLSEQDFTEFFLRALPKQLLQPAHDNRFLFSCGGMFRYSKRPRNKAVYSIVKWCLSFRRAEPATSRISASGYFARHAFQNYCRTATDLLGADPTDVSARLEADETVRLYLDDDLRNLCELAGLPLGAMPT